MGDPSLDDAAEFNHVIYFGATPERYVKQGVVRSPIEGSPGQYEAYDLDEAGVISGFGTIYDAESHALIATLAVDITDGANGEYEWSTTVTATTFKDKQKCRYFVALDWPDGAQTMVVGTITAKYRGPEA